MDSNVISFDGKQSDELVNGTIKFRRRHRPILPTTYDRTVKIVNRDGLFDYGRDLNERIITCDFVLESSTVSDMRPLTREVAEWLNVETAKELIFGDEEDKYYLARPIDGILSEQLLDISEGSITFLIPDVHAFSTTLTTVYKEGGILEYTNSGSVETPVTIELLITEAISEVTIMLTEVDYITLQYNFEENDIILIDTGAHTATLNSEHGTEEVDMRPYKTIDSSWFWLPAGNGNLIPTPLTTWCEIIFRERYI